MKMLTTKRMDLLLGISAGLIIIGAFFKIQHYPFGSLMLLLGLGANLLLSGIEIRRLRQIINDNGFKE